jgi:hypothetical protein
LPAFFYIQYTLLSVTQYDNFDNIIFSVANFFTTAHDYIGNIIWPAVIILVILVLILVIWFCWPKLDYNASADTYGSTIPNPQLAKQGKNTPKPTPTMNEATRDDSTRDEPQPLEPNEHGDGSTPQGEGPRADDAAGNLPSPVALDFPTLPRPRRIIVDDTPHLTQNAGPLERARQRKLQRLKEEIGDVPRCSRTFRSTFDEIVYLERLAEYHRDPKKGDWVHYGPNEPTSTPDYAKKMSQIDPMEPDQPIELAELAEGPESISLAATNDDEAVIAADTTSQSTHSPGDEEVELPPDAPSTSPAAISPAAINGDEATTAPVTIFEPTYLPGDADYEPLKAIQAKSWPYQADLQARALLTHADEDESIADDKKIASSDDSYREMELPSLAGTWAELVEKMEGLLLSSVLRQAVENDAATPPSIFDLSAIPPLEIEASSPDSPEEPAESDIVLPGDADMSDAGTPTPEPFHGDCDAGDRAEPTSGLLPPPDWNNSLAWPESVNLPESYMNDAAAVFDDLPDLSSYHGDWSLAAGGSNQMGMSQETPSGAESPILIDWDMIAAVVAASNSNAITSSAGELDFAAAGSNPFGMWMDGPGVHGQFVLPGPDMGDAPIAAGNSWDLSPFVGETDVATAGLNPVDTLMDVTIMAGLSVPHDADMDDGRTPIGNSCDFMPWAGESDAPAAGLDAVDTSTDGPAAPVQLDPQDSGMDDASTIAANTSEDDVLGLEPASGSSPQLIDRQLMCFNCFEWVDSWEIVDQNCFNCWAYEPAAPTLQAADESTQVTEEPPHGSTCRKRSRSPEPEDQVDTEDQSKDDDAPEDATKRVRFENDGSSVARATFTDPMFPDEDYSPLKEMKPAQVDRQIRKWMNRSIEIIQRVATEWETLKAQYGDVAAYNRMEPYLNLPDILKEIKAAYHRINQLNDYAEIGTPVLGQWNLVRDNKPLVNDFRSKFRSVEKGLEELEDVFDEDFDSVFNAIRDECGRFKKLTRHVEEPKEKEGEDGEEEELKDVVEALGANGNVQTSQWMLGRRVIK